MRAPQCTPSAVSAQIVLYVAFPWKARADLMIHLLLSTQHQALDQSAGSADPSLRALLMCCAFDAVPHLAPVLAVPGRELGQGSCQPCFAFLVPANCCATSLSSPPDQGPLSQGMEFCLNTKAL